MNDPHVGFIVAAYLVTFVAIGGTVIATVLRHRALKRALAELEPDAPGALRGIR